MTPAYKTALIDLLYQLADDNFILAYRGSEWLGLAPHIEEDVAFSSINQDLMGHAAMYYKLLEELGEGKADDLAHNRAPKAYRNAVLLELKNGDGDYMNQPHFDWAFTVVRHLFYAFYKKVRLEALKHSSYEPLAQAARKILTEHTYHLMHWETWFVQLMSSTKEARHKMEAAIQKVWVDFGDLLSCGEFGESLSQWGILATEQELREAWKSNVDPVFKKVGWTLSGEPGLKSGNGRVGNHTEDLNQAMAIFSEVYQSDHEAMGW